MRMRADRPQARQQRLRRNPFACVISPGAVYINRTGQKTAPAKVTMIRMKKPRRLLFEHRPPIAGCCPAPCDKGRAQTVSSACIHLWVPRARIEPVRSLPGLVHTRQSKDGAIGAKSPVELPSGCLGRCGGKGDCASTAEKTAPLSFLIISGIRISTQFSFRSRLVRPQS